MTLPDAITPAELAEKYGYSERRVRSVARSLGACRVLGRTMILIDSDVSRVAAVLRGEDPMPGPRPKRSNRSKVVYFFRQGDFIKIGWASDWRRRLNELQKATPNEITALAIYRGGMPFEQKLHAQFAEHRTRGEWFRDCDAIRQYIVEHKGACLLR